MQAVLSPLSFFPRRAHATWKQRLQRLWAMRRGITRCVAAQLPAGAMRRVSADHHDMELHCTRGELWITYDGDCKDLILREGERYRIERREVLVLYAFEDSVFEVQMYFKL
jgi:hypothetical protein